MSTTITRSDGRGALDTRPISISLGQLARADGSARFAYGTTACIASFTGPIEVRLREEQPDKATLEVSHRPLEGVGATPSRALEAALFASFSPLLALGQHPRSLLQLVVQSLSTAPRPSSTFNNGDLADTKPTHTWPPTTLTTTTTSSSPTSPISFSERASALNAASLSMLDAGSIALSSVLVAVSLALVPRPVYVDVGSGAETPELDLVVDPTPEEEDRATARFGFAWAYGSGLDTVRSGANGARGSGGDVSMEDGEGDVRGGEREAGLVWVDSEGQFSQQEFKEATALSRSVTARILEIYRSELKAHLQKDENQ